MFISRAPEARVGWRAYAVILVGLFALTAGGAGAQAYGTISGAVATEGGVPIGGAVVSVAGLVATTDVRGGFSIAGVPAGEAVVRAARLGYASAEQRLSVGAGQQASTNFTLREQPVEVGGLVVSATGQARKRSETPVAIGVVGPDEIRAVRPRHPSEIMGQIAGVWVGQTSGEGHTTAIRQPKSTKPMYLFLEDGVPTRSTGFFNHNALYEVNVPQASRVEVLKGPGTALYGSDAIGGVINVETRRASLTPVLEGSVEGGSNGWSRMLLSGSRMLGDQGLRADLNLTRSDGYRTSTGYERAGGTVRWDSYLPGNATVRTVASFSVIDQREGSALVREDYDQRPELNYNPIAYREVRAVRLSSALERPFGRGLLSLTPFVRANSMEILPFWMLSFDPVIVESGHRSAGALARVHYELVPGSVRLTAGADLEYSPGFRREWAISTIRDGRTFVTYTRGDAVYDYDVTFRGISPYAQADLRVTERLNLSLGLRHDRVGYAYDTHLEPVSTGRWRRPSDTTLWYAHLSPKAGLTYTLSPQVGLYTSYRRGFRAPAEGQVFRQGSSASGVELQPVRASSYEAGLRGLVAARLSYDAAVYRMDVEDDILTYVTQAGGAFNRVNVNAGHTRHQGLELTLGMALSDELRVDASYSNSVHRYVDWAPGPLETYTGNRVESAPREMSRVGVSYAPRLTPDSRVGLEWSRIGAYFMDPGNLHRYPGHNLLGGSVRVPIARGLALDGRVSNLLDTRFAETAAFNAAEGEIFNPGAPRSLNLAVQYTWGTSRRGE